MKILFSPTKRRIVAVLLLLFLLLPIMLTVTISAAEAADGWFVNNQSTAVKGILMLLMAVLLDRFTGDQKVEAKAGDPPVTSFPDSSQSTPYPPMTHYLSQGEKEVMGFYVNWKGAGTESYPSLTRNARNIDLVSPFWYTLTANGNVVSKYEGRQGYVHSFARQQGQLILPLINNDKSTTAMLTNPYLRVKSVDNLVGLIQENGYDGVNIDFENLPSWTKDSYTLFIRDLAQKLHARGKLVTISVFPKVGVTSELMGAYDYAALASSVDRIVMMTYDNHWSNGPAGSVAPIKWVENNIRRALQEIPASKLLLGIANYGYDWPANGGGGRDIAAKKAVELAAEKGSQIYWDAKTGSPYFYYNAGWGSKHVVWFENSYSLDYKLQLVNKYNLKGIAIWRLGNEEGRFWDIVQNRLNKS